MGNAEQDVTLSTITVHETDTGYTVFRRNTENLEMGQIRLAAIAFSAARKESREFSALLERLLAGKPEKQ